MYNLLIECKKKKMVQMFKKKTTIELYTVTYLLKLVF